MDNAETKLLCSRVLASSAGILCLLIAVLCASGLRAQTPEEHASHHPSGAAPAAGAMPAAGGASPASGGMMGGGMGEMMDGMMKKMGVPPPKDLYPSLMAVPELSPELRTQVEAQASERMHTGTVLMGQALDTLNAGTQSGDYAAMHEAMLRLREGAAQLESGIAARSALTEGVATRSVALAWFKQEMNLAPGAAPTTHQGSDVTIFHLFTMVLLVAFALAVVAMYFFKMRRAAALFGRIEADKGSPPPGSAPELAGGKPPDGKKPAGDAPAAPADAPAAPADKPAAPADKPAAPADKPAAPADTLAAPADRPAAKPASDTSPTSKGAAPSAPAQERLAATKFECLDPTARAVFLVGTFNDWNAKTAPMTKDAQGNWEVSVALPPGRHEFKFVVDGVLCCEPDGEGANHVCPKCVPNSSGTMNRFIEVT